MTKMDELAAASEEAEETMIVDWVATGKTQNQ
jgi:hypothetical protein